MKTKNELQLIEANNFFKIPHGFRNTSDDIGEGFVYALEFGDAVKVGMTKMPKSRIENLKSIAKYAQRRIGRLLLSPPHLNYKENETYLHTQIKNRIPGTELFNVCLDDVGKNMSKLTFVIASDEYRMQSLYSKAAKMEQISESARLYVKNSTSSKYIGVHENTFFSSYDLFSKASIELLNMLECIRDIDEPIREELFYKILGISDMLKNATFNLIAT